MGANATALARHALGLDGQHTTSYRNAYVVGPRAKEFAEWQRMVEVGDATRSGPHAIYGGDYIFRVTCRMARAVLRPGETLDLEDFPEIAHLSASTLPPPPQEEKE